MRPPSRFTGRSIVLLVLVSAAFVATPSRALAAVPEPPPPRAAEAIPDSDAFLPRWLHFHGSVGYGWIASPVNIRQRYEAGQGLELGVEARLRPRLRLRMNGEYQVLPAVGQVRYQVVYYRGPGGEIVSETLSFEWRGRGWLAAGRGELQFRALPHTWLLAGVGRGYMGAGMRAYHFSSPFETLDVEFPGSSGWAWISTLGARYEFDIFGPVLGVETRWSALDRSHDRLQTWSIRIGWQGK